VPISSGRPSAAARSFILDTIGDVTECRPLVYSQSDWGGHGVRRSYSQSDWGCHGVPPARLFSIRLGRPRSAAVLILNPIGAATELLIVKTSFTDRYQDILYTFLLFLASA
jgi:hypothetical protein